MENTENPTTVGEENAVRLTYPMTYSPIPKVIVKEEPTYEEDGYGCQLVAYTPLPYGVIKEEPELRDGPGESHSEVQVT